MARPANVNNIGAAEIVDKRLEKRRKIKKVERVRKRERERERVDALEVELVFAGWRPKRIFRIAANEREKSQQKED